MLGIVRTVGQVFLARSTLLGVVPCCASPSPSPAPQTLEGPLKTLALFAKDLAERVAAAGNEGA